MPTLAFTMFGSFQTGRCTNRPEHIPPWTIFVSSITVFGAVGDLKPHPPPAPTHSHDPSNTAEVEERQEKDNEEENEEEGEEESYWGGEEKEERYRDSKAYLGREAPQIGSRSGSNHAGGAYTRNGRCPPSSKEQAATTFSKQKGKGASVSKPRGGDTTTRGPRRESKTSSRCLWCQRHRASGRTSNDVNDSRDRDPQQTSPQLMFSSSSLAHAAAAAQTERARATHRPDGAHSAYSASNTHVTYTDELDKRDEHEEYDERDEIGERDESQEELSAGFREKPEAFFCSWECASRWNLRFSPVQARHERGLRIDVAAGRLVT